MREPGSPLDVTVAWLKAQNADNAALARSYMAPTSAERSSFQQAGPWPPPVTGLHCQPEQRPSTGWGEPDVQAVVNCTYHEAPDPGYPEFIGGESVDLDHVSGRWLVQDYGQG